MLEVCFATSDSRSTWKGFLGVYSIYRGRTSGVSTCVFCGPSTVCSEDRFFSITKQSFLHSLWKNVQESSQQHLCMRRSAFGLSHPIGLSVCPSGLYQYPLSQPHTSVGVRSRGSSYFPCFAFQDWGIPGLFTLTFIYSLDSACQFLLRTNKTKNFAGIFSFFISFYKYN